MEHDTEPTDAETRQASGDDVVRAPEATGDDVVRAPEATGDGVVQAPEGTGDGVAPAPEATGDPRVDAAIADLGDLAERPVSEHPPVFERIHGELVEVLGELHTGASVAGPAEPGESADG